MSNGRFGVVFNKTRKGSEKPCPDAYGWYNRTVRKASPYPDQHRIAFRLHELGLTKQGNQGRVCENEGYLDCWDTDEQLMLLYQRVYQCPALLPGATALRDERKAFFAALPAKVQARYKAMTNREKRAFQAPLTLGLPLEYPAELSS